MYVKSLLTDKFSEEELQQGGYTIITTLDMNLQTLAEDTVKKYGDYNEKHIGSKNLALLAEDPQTGQILAMVGSRDYWNTEAEGNVKCYLKRQTTRFLSFKEFRSDRFRGGDHRQNHACSVC